MHVENQKSVLWLKSKSLDVNPLYNDRKQSWSQTATKPPFSAARINERDKEGYIYTSLQSSSADTFWAIANPLGWKQLLIITYRGKVSALGLKTVSILKKCVYRNKFRQDKQMHTRVQKVDRLSKKDVAKHVDWWQSGGGRQTMFFQLYWTADTWIPPRPQCRERTLFGFFVHYRT